MAINFYEDLSVYNHVVVEGGFYAGTAVDTSYDLKIKGASLLQSTLAVSGIVTLSSVANASSDPDKFLCINGSNQVEYRTGAQVLSDIGAASSSSLSNYLPLAGGTMTGNLNLNDDVQLNIGSSDDFRLVHNATNSYIQNFTGDLQIQNNADDKDILFRCDDGSGGLETYFFLDGSAGGTNPITIFPDSSYLKFGSSQDLSIVHSGSGSEISHNGTGNLVIQNTTNDADIIFNSDNGSGGVAEYMRLDGSQVSVRMKRITKWDDNIKATWGDDLDIQIYSDNSTAYIEMPNLSNFIIGDSTTFNTGNIALVRVAELTGTKSMEEDWMGMYTSANTGFSYMTSSGTIRFNTTNSGVAVTGSLTATGDVEDRDIPCVLTSHFSDDSSTTSYLFMPFNNNSESSSNQYYNYFAAPQAGKVVSIMLMHVSGSMSSSFTTQLRVTKNGSAANTSGELTPSNGTNDGSYVEYAPGTVFAKGDRLQFSYQKSAGSKYWRGATATIVIELTDYDI